MIIFFPKTNLKPGKGFSKRNIVVFTCSKDDTTLKKLMHKSLKGNYIDILYSWMLHVEEYNCLMSTL